MPPAAAAPSGEGDSEAAAAAEAAPPPQLVESRSLATEAAALAPTCGFLGAPNPNHGHFFADAGGAGVDDAAERKVKLKKIGLDAKSAVAEQFSKSLGLRSG